MSETGPAITITPGVMTKVPLLPNQTLLVLDNLSTFALQVQVGASVRWQAPLVEDVYDLGANAAQVYVTATKLPGDTATSGTVTPTYYDTSEVPGKTWPIALAGPAEVAAATAAALLTTGVPNVLTETPVASFQLNRTGGGAPTKSAAIDVSAYAAVEVVVTPVAFPFGTKSGYYRSDDPTLASIAVADYLVANPALVAGTPFVQLIPVTAKYMVFYNDEASTDLQFTVTGTNRQMNSAYDGNGQRGVNLPAKYLLGSTVMVVGTTYLLANVNNDAITQVLIGECWMSFGLSTATAARGFLQYVYTAPDGSSQSYNLADTAEMHLDNPAGALSLYRNVTLPNIPTGQLAFNCRVAGTTAAFVTLVKNCG